MVSFLKTQGIRISQKQTEQLSGYYNQLKHWNRKHNLVSHNDENYLVERHFLPSFLYVYYLLQDGFYENKRLVDIGSGGGFPGIIISICFPDREITLIESIRKKTLFLKAVIKELNLNAAVIGERIEMQKAEEYDIITARALAALNRLDDYAKNLLTYSGRLYTIKGCDFEKEIAGRLNLFLEKKEIPAKWQAFSDRFSEKKMIVLKKTAAFK